jgi:hypothetical protein
LKKYGLIFKSGSCLLRRFLNRTKLLLVEKILRLLLVEEILEQNKASAFLGRKLVSGVHWTSDD